MADGVLSAPGLSTVPPGRPGAGRTRREILRQPGRVDRLFDRFTLVAGVTVLVIMTLIGVFLFYQSRHALAKEGTSFFTRIAWQVSVYPPKIGVVGLLFGTVIVALIAIVIAIPLGVTVGLYIAEYAPAAAKKGLQAVIDLLAAIPSILFGLWGFYFLSAKIVPLSRWLTTHLGWIPIFHTTANAQLTGSFFIAGIVVSLMVIPIVASITRAVFAQTPPGEKEAALALGSTRWGMVKTVVFPFGRGGIIGGSMLGLGRALGETIAVVFLLPQVPVVSRQILQAGGATISGFIANRAGGNPFTVSGLMAAGLVLFIITLSTNLIASTIVSRSRSGVGVDA
jgi:phosphate transport system permease protein